MRGADVSQPKLFVTNTVADFVPKDHSLHKLRALVDEALPRLESLFDAIYSDTGKAAVAPERLIRASLLPVLYTLRSERQWVEPIQYRRLFRWFVGRELDQPVWHHSTFSKNRERLLDNAVLPELFRAVLAMARQRHLLSDEHFSIDGTLIEAWASPKSFRRRDDDDDTPPGKERDYHGESRPDATPVSRTDATRDAIRCRVTNARESCNSNTAWKKYR
jgi:transposase